MTGQVVAIRKENQTDKKLLPQEMIVELNMFHSFIKHRVFGDVYCILTIIMKWYWKGYRDKEIVEETN